MHIDQLQAFDRIVREGSFSRAAWTLQIAQPTISARIQALEQVVGGALFTRTNQGVQLTPLGTSFLPYAQRALAMLTEGITVAQLAQQGQHGRLAVGILGSLTDCLLAPVLAQLHQSHPLIEWYVRAGSHRQVVEHLCDGVVEVALIAWPTVHPPGAAFVPLLHIREPVVCGAAQPSAHNARVRQRRCYCGMGRAVPAHSLVASGAKLDHTNSSARPIGGECAAGDGCGAGAGWARHRLFYPHIHCC
jgi:DNA-binding transcriptional LysR family regulator